MTELYSTIYRQDTHMRWRLRIKGKLQSDNGKCKGKAHTLPFSGAVVTDRAGVLSRLQQPKSALTNFDLRSHTAARGPSLPVALKVSTSVIHTDTWIYTRLPTPKERRAELTRLMFRCH